MSAPVASPPPTWRVALVIVAAVLAISSAAPIAAAADGVHPFALGFWRCALVTLLVSPWIQRLPRHLIGWTILGGFCLGLHFALWFWSIQLTDVVRSTVLVCLAPIWVGLFEWVVQRQPPNARWFIGVLVALIAIAAMNAPALGQGQWSGDALAIAAGICGAAYFLVGRRVRQELSIWSYTGWVGLAAALSLAAIVASSGVSFLPIDTTGWVLIVAMTLGPQLTGHAGLNYAVRFIPASTVTAVTLLEPVGAGLIAWVWLGEVPTLLTIGCCLLVTVGVGLASWSPSSTADA